MGRQYPVGIKNNEHFMVGSTSLPPKIDGQLRRHVVIEIPFIKWMDKRSNPNVFASVLWWGEEGKGTIFRPANGEYQKKSKRFIRAIYGITSGPKRFSDYLNDMKVMLINIFNESDSLPIGRAQVKNLSSLSPSHSISGLYPVMAINNQSIKIAEIKVHLSIASLESLHEGGVEVPTPDGGLDPVKDSETFLGDSKAAHGVIDALENSPLGADSNLEIVGKRMNSFGSNGKELREGFMDSIVDSLEKLRNEMTNSCLKIDVSGPVMEAHGDILASTLPNSSHLLPLQPADLILNSILDDDVGDIGRKFSGSRPSDDQKLLEHDELYELFYRNVPGTLDDININKPKKVPEVPKAPLKASILKKDSDVQLPPKLRRELSQATGILVLVNSLMAVDKLFVKEVRSDRELSSDCMLSISLSKTLHDSDAKPLTKMKPLLVKLKGRVLQFNQKVVISRTSLDLEDQGIFQHVLLFKLLERTSLSKFKVICRAECGILDLLMMKEQGAMKVNLEDKIGKCLGSLEINLKMLLEQRENCHNENLSDETKNANKKARICESEERKKLRKDVPMYACLVVPQGHVFVTHSEGANCVALKVRNHWSDSTTVKSTISKEGRVLFNLVQVHSLSLSASLLSKMKLNYVIVEVWTSNDSVIKNRRKEQLLGISKLPINTFHESFCNQERLQSSIDSTFPVVAVDGNVPVASPASGTNGGLLQVLLAMGTYDQVLRLMDFKMKTFPEFFHDSVHQLSLGSGERSHSMCPESAIEHMLELCIESVTKLTCCEMLEEEECFVRYIFPDLQEGLMSPEKFQLMRQQTSVVSCSHGDVKFNESFRQLVILPHHVSLCWHICKAYSANKLPNEITFQLWLRNDLSSVSEQLIAEGVLSLNEFFRAIDAKVPGDVGSSEFSIEMMKSSSTSFSHDEEVSCGFVNIRVLHSATTKEKAMLPSHANPLVEHAYLSVQILRACGLKCAAQAMQDSELEHNWNSQNGFNTFITTSLVINGQTNTKVTRVVGSSFRPAFNTHFEFLCPLNYNNSLPTSEKSSFLQHFEKAYLEVNVYSTNVDEGDNVKTSSGNNILIGRVKIFLIDILKRQTGLRGWLPIERPQQVAVKRFHWHDKERNMSKHVGGIEIAAEFSSSELESILREERRMSSVLSSVASAKKCNIQLKIDNLSFPVESLLHHGSPRNASARCYVTYKFFDQDTVHSQFYPLSLQTGVLNADINHVRDFHIVSSPTFIWYLTEERLEIQVWMSHGAPEDKRLPQADDEHVGSGYVSLADLVEFSNTKAISSGYCPLFNAHSDYLGSACLHYNIQASISEVKQDQEADNNTSGVDKKAENFREEDNFLARVAIERAYHLPKQLENNKQVLPNAYVTFETSTSFESTKVAKMDCHPVWNDEANVWLSKEFLNNGHENNLMLKVWHKSKLEDHEFGEISSDKCLGVASVDLKPLLSEKFQTITGFYNIIDYSGSQQGQIKVSVTPLQKVKTSPSNQIDMRDDKIGTDDIETQSTELVTKNITDALEELTTRLKQKISQSFDIFVHPSQDLHSLARDTPPERNHPGDRVEFNGATNERHSINQAFEKNPSLQNSSPNIFIQNYNLEPCECDGFQEHLSDNKDLICISMSDSPEGNEAVGLFSPEDSISHGSIEDCGCSSGPHLKFTEKSVQTENPVVTREVFESDLQNSNEIKPESARSTPSSMVSDLAERKNVLIGDWLSEHKRKVSQRIVAFKSFKVPSIEESQRIAKILANKLEEK